MFVDIALALTHLFIRLEQGHWQKESTHLFVLPASVAMFLIGHIILLSIWRVFFVVVVLCVFFFRFLVHTYRAFHGLRQSRHIPRLPSHSFPVMSLAQ